MAALALTFFFTLAEAPGPDELYDIVVPEPVFSPWPWIAGGILALIILGGLVWLVFFLLRQRRQPAPPAEFRALVRLDRVERDRDTLPPNRFALAVSDILKDFLAERFSDPVRYETTEEFLRRIARDGSAMPEVVRRSLAEFLSHADEVKFANRPDAAVSSRNLPALAREILALCRSVGPDGKRE